MLNKLAFKVTLAGLLASLSGTVSALEDQWYLGIGGGISQLQPDTDDTSIDVEDDNGQVATVFIGRDFDDRRSGQFQLYSLGEADYSDGQGTASYTAGDASLLYRFHDSRDRRPPGTIFGTAVYGRFGFGFMQRDSDSTLDTDTPVYFGAGAGIETYLSYNLAMRLEALFHGMDAGSATFTLVSRFGGRARMPAALPPDPHKPARPTESIITDTAEPLANLEPVDPEDTAETDITVQESAVAVPTDLPETYEIPSTGIPAIGAQPDKTGDDATMTDSDADGVLDDEDRCPESAPGYPVNTRGCPAFGGMLRELSFYDRTADLSNSSYAVLDKLVQLLNDYPTTYIEIVAHTDNLGTEAEQSELTRQRLRSIGVYLVRHGISQDRLLLRSYGGLRPLYDNATTEGRRRNNRIEIFENP